RPSSTLLPYTTLFRSLWPSPNMPTDETPTVPAIDTIRAGSRLTAIASKTRNSLDRGHGSSMAVRNQLGIPLLAGTGVDWTDRSWPRRYASYGSRCGGAARERRHGTILLFPSGGAILHTMSRPRHFRLD